MGNRVRVARPADIPEMEAVYYRSWRGAYEPFIDEELLEELAIQRSRDFDWSRGMHALDASVFVGLDDDGSIVGVAQANEVLPEPRGLPEITMLYVEPASWGTGIASSLLTASTTWVQRRGHAATRLRVVESHARARRFYEREGWTPDPELDPVDTGLVKLVYYRRQLSI